ncbi:MAG: hypothetical protein FH753_16575 [Firmicutes bacterium]|nr:hypothetical protein [Bacillota bacterium]
MKKIFALGLILIIFSGCNTLNSSNKKDTSIPLTQEEKIKYSINKTVLSRGYESLKPRVEILDKETKTLLINLGILDCLNVSIDKITFHSGEINIYTRKLTNNTHEPLVIPKITITLNEVNNDFLENKSFNIIATNYKPVELPFNKTHVLNNIYSHFEVTSNTKPKVKLYKEDNNYFWHVKLENVFEKNNENPLVNISAKVDALKGEITTLKKENIAKFIDNGKILDTNKNLLLYKINNNNEESMWLYNIKTKKSKKVYTTHHSIFKAKINNNKVALIENSNDKTDIFLIDTLENTTEKITPLDFYHTLNIKWINNKLYFDNNTEENYKIFKYNSNDKNKVILSKYENFSNFDIINNNILLNKFNPDKYNTDIYLIDENNIKLIQKGSNANYLDNETIIYLKKENNNNFLCSYDLKTEKESIIKRSKEINYHILNDRLFYICKNEENNYDLYIYDEDEKNLVTTTIDEKIFYVNGNIFINAAPTIEKTNSKIYLLDNKNN